MKKIKRVRTVAYVSVLESGAFFCSHLRSTRADANSVTMWHPLDGARIAKVRITEIAPTKKRRKGKGK